VDQTLAALEELYQERYEHFRRMLATITGDYDTARDATQQAFAPAVAQRHSFRGEAALGTWVWRIELHAAIDQRRSDIAYAEPTDAVPEVAFVEAERDPEFAAAVQTLPPRQRLMLFLRYFADLSYREVAELCDVSEGTVAASLHQARAHLRSVLQREGVTP